MLRLLGGFACVLSVALAPACGQEEPERPPPIASGASSGLPPSGGGDGDDPGGGPNLPDEGVAGLTYLLLDDRFVDREAFLDTVSIFVMSGGEGFETEQSEAGEFAVVDAVPEVDQWIYARPVQTGRAYPTVVRKDTTQGPVDVELVQFSVIDEIMLTLSQSTSVNPNAAQLLIQIVDQSGNGVSGVQAQVIEESTVISYATGDSWNDLRDNTDTEGLIFAPNLLVDEFPGDDIQVVLTGAIAEEHQVRVIEGAITVFRIVVP